MAEQKPSNEKLTPVRNLASHVKDIETLGKPALLIIKLLIPIGVAAYLLLSRNWLLGILVILVISIVTASLACRFILNAKKTEQSPILSHDFSDISVSTHRYSAPTRDSAAKILSITNTICFLLISLLIIAGLFQFPHIVKARKIQSKITLSGTPPPHIPSPQRKIQVYIADFQNVRGPVSGDTENILERLENTFPNDPNIHIKALGRTITRQQGTEFAREEGKKLNADLVVWGWYMTTSQKAMSTVHFEMLNRFKDLPLHQNHETLLSTMAEQENITIQIHLSRDIACVALIAAGLIEYERDNYKSAVTYLRRALKETAIPAQVIGIADVYFFLGNAYNATGDYKSAIYSYDKAIKHHHGYKAYYNQGNAYAALNNYPRALNDYNKVVAMNPGFAYVYNSLGLIYYSKKSYSDAYNKFNKAIELNKDYWEAYLNRANSLQAMADTINGTNISRAEVNRRLSNKYHTYSEIVSINRMHSDTLEKYKSKMQDQNRLAQQSSQYYSRALDDLNKALQICQHKGLGRERAYIYNNRGLLYMRLKKLDEASADFGQAIKLNDALLIAYVNRATVSTEKCRSALITHDRLNTDRWLKSAETDLIHVQQAKPQVDFLPYTLGMLYQLVGQHNSAINQFSQAIKLNKRFKEAYTARGLSEEAVNSISSAARDYETATKLDTKYLVAWYSWARLLKIKKHDYKGALNKFTKATQCPSPLIAYIERGNLYCSPQMHNLAAAKSDFLQAIKLENGSPIAYYNLGNVYLDMGSIDKSITMYKQALARKPDYKEAEDKLAIVNAIKKTNHTRQNKVKKSF